MGLTSIIFPNSFYLFAFNAQSCLPVWFQAFWTALGISAVVWVDRHAARTIPAFSLYVIAALSIASFFILRTTYPTLLGDGTPPAKGFILHVDKVPRFQEYLCLKLSSWLPREIDLPYHRTNLFDNQLISNSCLVVTMILAAATTVVLLVAVGRSPKCSTMEKAGLLMLLTCSGPMLNGYGDFANYIGSVLTLVIWFVCLWRLGHTPIPWYLYAFLPVLFVMCMLSHPALWYLPALLILLLTLTWLRSRNICAPSWFLGLAVFGLGCAPLVLRPDRYLAQFRFDETFGLRLYTRFLCCMEVAAPALLLAALIIWKHHRARKHLSPVQEIAVIVLGSSLLHFITSDIEMAVCTVLQYSLFGATIYGSVVILSLSTDGNSRSVIHSGILACFLFVPAAVVHSGSLLVVRQLALLPHDRSSLTYQVWGPYLKLGLGTPMDTPENCRYKLDVFKDGATTTIPDWQQFRGLNLLYYTAWCFELGYIDEGMPCLTQLFDQPQALQNLWHSGTQLTVFNENKAYKRIRQASRKIIQANLVRAPTNRYLQDLSRLLDMYEERDP